MASARMSPVATQYVGLPTAYMQAKWYAAYTKANHERRVAWHLADRSVENYLPIYESVRRWKDRRVVLELPVFPGYVFVKLALRDRLKVLEIPGVARLVGFNGTPSELPQRDIDALKKGLEQGLCAEPHPYLTTGRRIRVKHGPLAGLEGVLLRRKGNWRLVVSLDLIHRSVAVDVDASDVEPAIG